MVNKMLLAVIFLAAVADAHYMYGQSSYSNRQTVKQNICSTTEPCPSEAVCCLKAYQGRCYYGSFSYFYGYVRTLPTESATCLKDTSFGDGSDGSKCAKDGDCNADLICDELSSNRWGVCKTHPCDDRICDDAWSRACDKDASGPGYTCDCTHDEDGTLITVQSIWAKGKNCEEEHQCANATNHKCGDFGTCVRDDNDNDEMKCECEAGWFGEKCNSEGSCAVDLLNACSENATCESTGPDTYTCDCTGTNMKGKDCDESPCAVGCGDGECIFATGTTNGFNDNNVWEAEGECKCPINKHGAACASDCGGVSIPSELVIDGSDALCIYRFPLNAFDSLTVETNQKNEEDPFCITHYVEAFVADDNHPVDNTNKVDEKKNRCPGEDNTWEFDRADELTRVVFSIKDNTTLTITKA